MKAFRRVQRDLFTAQDQVPELVSSDRQKAIALLQALLTEATIDQVVVPLSDAKQETDNE